MVAITPDTKVGALLDAYPTLEETLVGLAPEFAKLRNPILRRTVAKVATLEQAARIAGIEPRSMVLALRRAAGFPDGDATASSDATTAGGDAAGNAAADTGVSGAQPAPGVWLDLSRVRVVIDADAILARGDHPLGAVRAALRDLAPGDILRIDSGFRPVPLLDALAKEGFATAVDSSGGRVRSFVRGR
jgi:hypothetical protein